MFLYYDLKEGLFSPMQIKIFFPVALAIFALAVYFYFSGFSYSIYLSAWSTALATYLLLYHMISFENSRKELVIGKVLKSFGKNSYGIFLIHTFFVWRFVERIEIWANKIGFSIHNVPGFILVMPLVVALCYFAGVVFNKIIKGITRLVFRKA